MANKDPWIAVSVDMMDTGIDVPECVKNYTDGLKYADTFGYIAALSGALHILDEDADEIGGESAVFGNLEDARKSDKNPGVLLESLVRGGAHEWDFWDGHIKKVIEWLPLDNPKSGINNGNVKKD